MAEETLLPSSSWPSPPRLLPAYFPLPADAEEAEAVFRATRSEEDAIEYLQGMDCLKKKFSCSFPGCGRNMSKVRGSNPGEFFHRCPCHKSHKKSFRHLSFWTQSSLPMTQHLRLMFSWARMTPVAQTVEHTGISVSTVVKVFQSYREICGLWLRRHPYHVGGQGKEVQVELVALRESRRCKAAEVKVMGIYCTEDEKGFLAIVEDWSDDTLLPLVPEHVAPGSVLRSRSWPACRRVPLPFVHVPGPGDPTVVENFWQGAKRRYRGIPRARFPDYIAEFLWREVYVKGGPVSTMEALLRQISQLYPVM